MLREQAAVVALVEVQSQDTDKRATVQVHKRLKSNETFDAALEKPISLDLAVRPGMLLVVFGTAANESTTEVAWHGVAVDETSYAYIARLPAANLATARRLEYFADRLEHANPVVAEDVYLEFGHARLEDVAAVIPRVPMDRVRRWLLDPQVRPERKGFYGLALGLATDPADRRANAELLRRWIETPDDDFRAGFDGALGGYLMLEGEQALAVIVERYLANPHAADGDVRHAQAALRFYHEYGRAIPPARLAEATRHLLVRREFAESAIVDLARWQDWAALASIEPLYARADYPQPSTRRAVVGFLLACPGAEAAGALARLRASDPRGVAEAERALSKTTGLLGDSR